MAQGQGNNLQEMLKGYSAPTPDIAQAYMRSFNKGGPIDVPSFQELYGSYSDVANKEADRQSAKLTEAYGSQGARYGSDLMAAQGQVRKDTALGLAKQGGDLLQGLRSQQFGEASALGNLQYGISEAAMARLFQDYMRQTGVPPLFGAAQTYSPSGPTTIVS